MAGILPDFTAHGDYQIGRFDRCVGQRKGFGKAKQSADTTDLMPGQPDHQCLQLLRTQGNPFALPGLAPNKATLVQATRREPQAKAIVHQNLSAVTAFVGKQVGTMGFGFTEHLHDTGQRRIRPSAHIQWFGLHPDLIDLDHACNARSQGMARSIWASGQRTLMPRNSKTASSATPGGTGSGTGTNFCSADF